MPALHLHLPRSLRLTLAGALLAVATSLLAATGGFISTLSADQQSAASLPALSAAERLALDQLVAAELTLVRQGAADDNSGTFASRLTDAEFKSAGLDRLPPAALAKLNEFVSMALATHPKPKERPRLKDDEVLNPARKPEIHGSVSMTVGTAGHGRSFWGSSLWLDYFDPSTGLGLSVGLSNYSGKGFYGYYPDYYGFGYDNYAAFPIYSAAPFRSLAPEDFSYGDGQSFQAKTSLDSAGFGRHRR